LQRCSTLIAGEVIGETEVNAGNANCVASVFAF